MSILFENEYGYYISHQDYINKLYEDVENCQYAINESLFDILYPYKKSKNSKISKDQCNKSTGNSGNSTEVQFVKRKFEQFTEILTAKQFLKVKTSLRSNQSALEAAEQAYNESGLCLPQNCFGFNKGPASVKVINNSSFLFPENAEFFCKDVSEIALHMENRKFDLILLDPPWWNKYIRRKRKKSNDGYKMLFNTEIKTIPVEKLLNEIGIVIVWCTNSSKHLSELIDDIFPKWEVHLTATWYWVKVTQKGEPICDFSDPPGKQPYERIIIATKNSLLPTFEDKKIIVSVPSAIHSHKPPLIELLRPYLPEKPDCLEIFARYLLPGFTSYGNEVLKLQHCSIFHKI